MRKAFAKTVIPLGRACPQSLCPRGLEERRRRLIVPIARRYIRDTAMTIEQTIAGLSQRIRACDVERGLESAISASNPCRGKTSESEGLEREKNSLARASLARQYIICTSDRSDNIIIRRRRNTVAPEEHVIMRLYERERARARARRRGRGAIVLKPSLGRPIEGARARAPAENVTHGRPRTCNWRDAVR